MATSSKKIENLAKVQAASQKQYRMMMAILHSKKVDPGSRGRPPKAVAAKYTSPGKGAPDSKHNDKGGTWSDAHHKKHAEKHSKKEKEEKAKKKKDLKKAFDEFMLRSQPYGVGCIVVNEDNHILMGTQEDMGMLATPGGHIEPGETPEMAAARELKEESGLIAKSLTKLQTQETGGRISYSFVVDKWEGDLQSSAELKNLHWVEPQDIEWNKVRNCCVDQLKYFITANMGHMIKGMLALENLQKADIHDFQVSQLDANKLVGNGIFRILREHTDGMTDEEFRDINIDTCVVRIRKHVDGTYSGNVSDGHKVIHSFVNRPLPKLAADLMALFEFYSPEDEHDLMILDEQHLPDDAIHGGLDQLVDNYKKHNLANIYSEMEHIREQMRSGMAVDLQQVEQRIMKLFDKLQTVIDNLSMKHNQLAGDAGDDIDEIEERLKELQRKIEELEKRPQTVEAYSSDPGNPRRVLNDNYPYLTRPQIEISPSGKIRISFGDDWQPLEKENLLRDLKAKVISKGR